jgi:PST family polysaccharide transporter
VSVVLGLASAKVMALLLHPSGYGYFGLLQSFVAVISLLAGWGMATGLVRQGASAANRGEADVISNLRRGAWLLFWAIGSAVLIGLLLFREAVSRWALGTPAHSETILVLAIAVLFTVAANVQNGILNTYHKVEALATYGVANSVLGASIGIITVLLWKLQGVVAAVIAGAIVSWGVSAYLLRSKVGRPLAQPSRKDTLNAARSLLRFGGPFTASQLVGTGVQLALPIVVLHLLSTDSVGYYKAATAISVNYLGFLVAAMGQDYYPRVSAVKDRPKALVALINEQHRLVMLLGVPMILGTLALVPYLVPLVYSRRFLPTVAILEWQLIGDLFKFSSWTMSFAVLGRCRPSVYFLLELTGGLSTVVTTWLAVRWFGLTGLGIGFLLTYIIYYGAVWLVVRRDIGLVFTASNKRMMLAAVGAALVIRALGYAHYGIARTVVALALAGGASVFSLTVLWRQYVSGREIRLAAPETAVCEVGAPE